ncbi:DUF2231 domain-containing protein [Amycolatopsis sp. NPDC005232]|uniref:DUF2231 domain-containing protein n=1 Tax=Amycolatopsis sp. NPDC005232 TaxID=3157027 RepID=UPI0033BCDEBB
MTDKSPSAIRYSSTRTATESPPHRLLSALEDVQALDAPAAAVVSPVGKLFSGQAGEELRGRRLGHPLHPLAVTLPIGAWACSSLLDLVPGNDEAARRLVGVGLLAAPAAAVLGAADYHDLDERQRRVGFCHLVLNLVATVVFAASYRRRHRCAAGGKLLGALGLLVLSVGGALGGHLSYAQGAGVFRWQRAESQTSTAPVTVNSRRLATDTAWSPKRS